MKNSTSFEIVAEVLNDCVYKCNDCYVDKNTHNTINDHFYNVAFNMMELFHPFAITLGSTDLFTSNNTLILLNNIQLCNLIDKFDRLVFNSTLVKLDNNVIESINALNVGTIQINVVIPYKKVDMKLYLIAIKKNIDKLTKRLNKEVILHTQLNASLDIDIEEYDELNSYIKDYLYSYFDFNPSFMRSTNLDNNTKIKHFQKIRHAISTSNVKNDLNMKDKHIDVLSNTDLCEREIYFANGKFFIVPKLYEICPIEDSYLNITSLDSYINKQRELINRQYQYAYNNKLECIDCSNLPVCVERGTIYLYEKLENKDCLLPRNIIEEINYGISYKAD